MSGDLNSPMRRGRLSGRDRGPFVSQLGQGFSFATQNSHKPRDQCTGTKLGGEQLVDLYDLEDFQLRDTVEGDGIRQVLMESSRPRARRGVSRHYTEPTKIKVLAPERVAEETKDSLAAATANDPKYKKVVREVVRREDADEVDNTEQDSSSSWTILQWAGSLLIGMSILLTWPVGLAYMRG